MNLAQKQRKQRVSGTYPREVAEEGLSEVTFLLRCEGLGGTNGMEVNKTT